MKGCNMACGWCHNPEPISPAIQTLLYPENCIGCGNCNSRCYSDARVVSGVEMTAEEILAQVTRDIPYYNNTGGGVTLTGGEVVTQPEAAIEFLSLCKANRIHTAIESNFHAAWETIVSLLNVTDLVIADIKHPDSAAHKLHTGVHNELILENIKRLDDTGIPFIIHTPVIPGVNDSVEIISAIAGFLSGMKNLLFFELLNFNPLGAQKYKALNMTDKYANAKPLSEEKMNALISSARKHSIEVRCR
jgi:pyruvate formate lyase activating enzyme